jgi:N-acetylglucosamine kinase-like BadF-type ATPase
MSRGIIVRDPATFAPRVTAAAQAGDVAAVIIVQTAAQLLADNAMAVARQLDLVYHAHSVVIAGGVSRALFDPFAQALRRAMPVAQAVCLACDPVVGAVLLACDAVQPDMAVRLRRILTNEE